MTDNRAPRIAIVAAVASNGVIGDGGALPWRIRSELRRFRQLTLGKPVIMGRKTFQSLAKPLDGRDNIVVSRQAGFAVPAGVLVAASFDAALVLAVGCAAARGAEEILVIGGAEIYRAALPATDRIYLTRVDLAPAGDTLFPALVAADWVETASERHAAVAGEPCGWTLLTLDRRR